MWNFKSYPSPAVLVAALSVSVLLPGFSAKVLASNNQLTEEDYFGEVPMVLSATRMPQSTREAPVSVTIIDRQMIEASGFTEIPDLMRLVPGFLVDYDSGHIQAVSYHMLHDRFVRQQQVLVDGRSVYSPNIGGVDWTSLPITIDDIERIEVVRGANAATYGSNSFMGVINIITREAVLDRGVSVKGNVGSNDLVESFLRFGNSVGRLDYRFNAAYRTDDGFDDRYDGKEVRLLNGRFDYQIDNNDSLSFQAGYSEGPREEDNTIDSGIPNHLKEVVEQFQHLKWRHIHSSSNEYSLQLYHTSSKETKNYTRTDIPIFIDEFQDSERIDLEFQQVVSPLEESRLVWGMSYREDKVTSPLYFGTQDSLKKRTRRLFGHSEYRVVDDLLLNVGLMLEDNDITGSELSPRVALNYDASKDDTLRLSYSRATRTPVLFEEYPDAAITTPVYDQLFFDGGTVESETIDNYEIAWVGNSSDRTLFYDAKLFHEDIEGLISYDDISPFPDINNEAAIFDNFDDVTITGVEGTLDYRPTDDMRLRLTYANINIQSDDNQGQYSIAAPEHSATFMGIFQLPNDYSTSLNVYYRSEMKPLARRGIDPDTVPDYTRVDWRVAKNIRIQDGDQQFAFVIQNIFDNVDYSVLNNFQGREYYFTYKVIIR